MYGSKMTAMWGDCPGADLMDAWCEALAGIPVANLRAALDNVMAAHPEWPPTLGQFLALCKPAPIPQAHRPLLPDRRAREPIDPRIQREISAMLEKQRKRDPKDWARQILSRQECGERLLPIQIQFAREALGL